MELFVFLPFPRYTIHLNIAVIFINNIFLQTVQLSSPKIVSKMNVMNNSHIHITDFKVAQAYTLNCVHRFASSSP